jgi:hypothetical protein
MRSEKVWNKSRSKLFLIVIFHFSLVKATVNALRLCELRKDCFTAFFLVAYLAISKTSRRSKTLKGSQRMGGGQNSLKNLRASPFYTVRIYQMRPLLA